MHVCSCGSSFDNAPELSAHMATHNLLVAPTVTKG